MLPQDKVLMLVRIPQEIEKRVLAFEQLLVNIHEILHHMFLLLKLPYNQYIYFFRIHRKKSEGAYRRGNLRAISFF